MKWLRNTLIAHRGFHSKSKFLPENSLGSFKEAVNQGYAIELDVRIMKDNIIIVFHDDNLNRMVGLNKYVEDMTYDMLKDVRLINSNEKIPLFKEVLKEINGKVPLLIEIKNNKNNGVLENKLCKILDGYKGEYAVQSFNPLSLFWVKKYRKDILIGRLVSSPLYKEFYRNFTPSRIWKIISMKYDFEAYSIDHPIWFIKCKKKYIPILGWTVKSKKVYNKLHKVYDSIIFEKFNPIK